MIIIVTIVVSITDAVVFWKVKQHPERIAVGFVILVILVTLIPIYINFWYHSLITRMLIIVTIVVSITDAIVFWKVKQHPERITVGFVILVILVTLIPIYINFWYHSLKR